jgi:hypothetical protein
MSLSHVPRHPTPPSDERSQSPPPVNPPPSFDTDPNKLGVFRRYPHLPSWHPEGGQSLDSVCDASTLAALPPAINPSAVHELDSKPLPHEPFSSRTAAIFMALYHEGSEKKSAAHANSMARGMFDDPEFDLDELGNFSTERENARLDAFLRDGSVDHPFRRNDGCHEASIRIRIPVRGDQFTSESEAPEIQIDGLYYRHLIDVITAIFQDEGSKSFHFSPFQQYWIPDDDDPEQYERLYSEMYTTDTVLDSQIEVEALPREDGDNLERVVIPLMLASDSAHLTSFGSASVWPIYVGFGNQTKYDRAKPSAHATHHLAYVPSVRQQISNLFLYSTWFTAWIRFRTSICRVNG